MINALINIANLIIKLVAKANTDPDVQALVAAIEALVSAHNATPPSPPAA